MIRVLDSDTINKIAAGEVVERPASVVKELVENAVDAGASRITVEVEDGGRTFIRVTDNGYGIKREDVRKAFYRHATSKITSIEDLLTVSSLGFRGEALSSIASVGMVEMFTKAEDEDAGTKYVIEGGDEITLEDASCAPGTSITVRYLFFNTPARRKFLRAPATELGYINDVMTHIALSHPEISFSLISGEKTKLRTAGNMSIKDMIYQIYGRDAAANLMPIDYESDLLKMSGYLGKPAISRGNRAGENYFINGRFIKNFVITKALEEAYKPYVMQHKFPFAVLHLDIDPSYIDVNVHPAKMEMRLNEGNRFYEEIFNAIRNVIEGRELIPRVLLDKPIKSAFEEGQEKDKYVKTPETFDPSGKDQKTGLGNVVFELPKYDKDEVYPRKFNSLKKPQEHSPVKGEQMSLPFAYDTQETEKDEAREPEPYKKPEPSKEPDMLGDLGLLTEENRAKHKLIGQLFATYWLVSFEDNLFIIDQHAAHEKVLYERFTKTFLQGNVPSQQLMPPLIVTLTPNEIDMIERNIHVFEKAGFELEPFGDKEYAVRSLPADLYGADPREYFMDFMDNMMDEYRSGTSELISDRIATMACKAAVKGNDVLSFKEADALIDELLKADNPYNCPHGRPTIISISKYELEKKFSRIV